MAGVLLIALLVVLSLVRGWDPWVGLRSRGLCGCGLVAAGFVRLWWVWYGGHGGILGWVCVLVGLVGVVWVRRALWVFGGVCVCGWFLGLGVGWALWSAAVLVWLLWGVGFGPGF